MSSKITVKRTRQYIRFFVEKREVSKISNLYGGCPEYTDKVLIKGCLVPYLIESLKEDRSRSKQLIIETNKLIRNIQLQQEALNASGE